jgi:hypothetical protein
LATVRDATIIRSVFRTINLGRIHPYHLGVHSNQRCGGRDGDHSRLWLFGHNGCRPHGVAPQFTGVSGCEITAALPTGAKTGKITVTNSGGTATSKSSYTVNQVRSQISGGSVRRLLFAVDENHSLRLGRLASLPIPCDLPEMMAGTPGVAGGTFREGVLRFIHNHCASAWGLFYDAVLVDIQTSTGTQSASKGCR